MYHGVSTLDPHGSRSHCARNVQYLSETLLARIYRNDNDSIFGRCKRIEWLFCISCLAPNAAKNDTSKGHPVGYRQAHTRAVATTSRVMT